MPCTFDAHGVSGSNEYLLNRQKLTFSILCRRDFLSSEGRTKILHNQTVLTFKAILMNLICPSNLFSSFSLNIPIFPVSKVMVEGDLVFRSGFDATEAMEAHISDLNFGPRAEQNSAHPKLQGCRKKYQGLGGKKLEISMLSVDFFLAYDSMGNHGVIYGNSTSPGMLLKCGGFLNILYKPPEHHSLCDQKRVKAPFSLEALK